MLALDQWLPCSSTTAVSCDVRRRTDDAVLDHLFLFSELRDDLLSTLTTAAPSPMPPVALITLLTGVTRDAPPRTRRLFKPASPSPFEHRTTIPTPH